MRRPYQSPAFKFGLSVEHEKYSPTRFLRDRLSAGSNVSTVSDSVEPGLDHLAIATPSLCQF
jgi:hypothetical protein